MLYIIVLESELSFEDIVAGKVGVFGGKGLVEWVYYFDEIFEKGLKVDLYYYLF